MKIAFLALCLAGVLAGTQLTKTEVKARKVAPSPVPTPAVANRYEAPGMFIVDESHRHWIANSPDPFFPQNQRGKFTWKSEDFYPPGYTPQP